MYETIMELPLFKGIATDQLSALLEKTSVDFVNFADGETLTKAHQKVEALDFILSGKVLQRAGLDNFDIKVEAILGPGSVIGVLNLFGLDTTYIVDSRALGKTSLMRIGKTDYMNILRSDSIYILNFVNYLSAGAQKGSHIIRKSKGDAIGRSLEILAYSVVSRLSETIKVCGEDSEIARYCGCNVRQLEEWKEREEASGKIRLRPGEIILKHPEL